MTTGRRRVAAAATMALAIALTSCQDDDQGDLAGGTSTTAPDPTSAPDPPPTTSATPTTPAPSTTSTTGPATTTTVAPPPVPGDLGILDGAVDDDGTLALESAKSLFAAGYAPLPGVDPAPEALLDGTPVLRTLLAQFEALTEEQRRIVETVTEQPGVRLLDVPDDPRQQAALGTINLGLGLFAQLLGRELRSDVRVTLAALPYENPDGTRNFSSPTSHATALPFGDGVVFDECRIRLNVDAPVDATVGFGDPVFLSEVAEETFHCLQYGLVGLGADIPLWVMEGAAAFAGEDFAQGSARSAPWWRRWIEEPGRPLQERTYDAAGFFFLIKGRVDVYQFTDVFLSEATLPSIYRRLAPSDAFDQWGSQYATEPSWGPSYAISGFGAPTDVEAPSTTLTVTLDGPPVLAGAATASAALNAATVRFRAPGDVLVVTTDPGDRGRIRFGDGDEATLTEATRAYCLKPEGCVCEGVPPDQQPTAEVTSADVFIGLGPSTGGGPELTARSLARWCDEALLPAPPAGSIDQCLARRWVTTAYVAPASTDVLQETTGGDGSVLDLRPDGTAVVDMTAATPVVVTSQGAGGVVTTTTLEYRGVGTGTWRAAGGVIDLALADPGALTVRVRVDAADGGQLSDATLPAGDLRLSGYAGVPGRGRVTCSAGSMTLTRVTPGVGGRAAFEFADS